MKKPSIFKRIHSKSNTKESTMLGVFVPQHIHLYSSLYSLMNKIPISISIRDVIIEWYNEKEKKMPVKKIIRRISSSLQSDWDGYKTTVSGSKKREFKNYTLMIRTELEKKKIPESSINQILKRIKL